MQVYSYSYKYVYIVIVISALVIYNILKKDGFPLTSMVFNIFWSNFGYYMGSKSVI